MGVIGARWPHRPGDEGTTAGRFSGQLDSGCIDPIDLVGQSEMGQFYGVCSKRIRFDKVTSGLNIFGVDFLDQNGPGHA